jgi:hypothetical protein
MDAELKEILDLMRQDSRETRQELALLRSEMTNGFAEVRQEFVKVREEFVKVRKEMHVLNAETRMELGTLIEEQRHNTELVAEQFLDLHRQLGLMASRDEMERGFEEVKAMIHGLDGRLRAIEESN